MGAKVGATYTGSFTFASGSENSDMWLWCGDPVAMTISSGASNPDPFLWKDLIKTDLTGFVALALHVKTTKTVSGQSVSFTGRTMYAWGGVDEDHRCRFAFHGANEIGQIYIDEGSASAADYIANMQTNKLAIDGAGAGYVTHTLLRLKSSQHADMILPMGIVGVMLKLHTGATAITTTNTWAVEATWCYWF